MKKYLTAAFLASVFFLSAGEREDLLQSFQRETAVAWQKFQAAETTVDLTAAAGNCYHTASVQVLKALDYKLRHTASSTERLKLLKDFQDLSCEAERVLNTPRENMGSSGAMHISNAAANLFQQHTAVLLLKGQDEIRWKELENALWVHGEKKIVLKHGKGKFEAEMHGTKVTLETVLYPGETFTYVGRHFAILRSDLPFACSDDYSEAYLAELKNDKKLHTIKKLPCPLYFPMGIKGRFSHHPL